ncbi:MAG: phosphocholine cytidylyltransferase family protein [Lentisphaerae bacterium]|nr:phosphocholine cytidylyltransferase family protein [Lentisphaerota bacterium]
MVEEAIIIAGGMGRRIAGFHDDKPKGFITLDPGVPIVKQSIDKLLAAGIKRVIIGTGYHSEYYEELAKEYDCVETICNTNYANTGSMGTLEVAATIVKGDTLLLESDLIYEKSGLKVLLDSPFESAMLASGTTHSGDEVYVEVDERECLVKLSKKREDIRESFGELTGLTKLSHPALMAMCRYAEERHESKPRMEYEEAMSSIDLDVHVVKYDKFIWCEIDDPRQHANAMEKVYPAIKAAEQQ